MCCMTTLYGLSEKRAHGGNEEGGGGKGRAHMLSMPDAEEVLPRRRNHGLNPSEEPFEMMR